MTEPVPPSHGPIGTPKGIGVFICSCGGVISRKVDLDRIKVIANADANVRDVLCFDRGCDGPALGEVKLSLMAGDIDRFMVVGCSARSASERFAQLAESAGICPELVTFVDIIGLCGPLSRSEAQGRAERAMRTSLRRIAMLQTTPRMEVGRSRKVLVIGNGPSAITASMALLDEGLDVIVANPTSQIEESDHQSVIPLEGGALDQMADSVGDRFRVHDSTEVRSIDGHPGDFTVTMSKGGETWKETVGGAIVALDKVDSTIPCSHDSLAP